MPIHNFNEVSNGNFDYLKRNRKDKVSEKELQETWLTIIDEYFILSKNVQGIENLKKKAVLILLQNKMQIYESMKICLRHKVNIDDAMKMYGVNEQDLPQYIALVKYDIDDLNMMLQKTEVHNDNEFDENIAILSQAGFRVNRFKTVVSEWIAMQDIFKQQQSKLKKDGTTI